MVEMILDNKGFFSFFSRILEFITYMCTRNAIFAREIENADSGPSWEFQLISKVSTEIEIRLQNLLLPKLTRRI